MAQVATGQDVQEHAMVHRTQERTPLSTIVSFLAG